MPADDPAPPSIEDLTPPLLRINKLCDQFRRAWKSGDSPSLEDYPEQVGEGPRPSLLRNLLPIDLEARRRKRRESPTSDEYIRRSPEFAKLIRQAFFESTMASLSPEQSTPLLAATERFEPAANRLGDYELIGKLGQGGFGVVYEARHVRRGDRVALKTLPLEAGLGHLAAEVTQRRKQSTGDRLMRFKREFRTLADMNHPNLVGLHSLEADGDQWFFTMDLIDGEDFLSYVRPGGQFDETRLRAALPQLVVGVMALHNRNVIHRDLKPSNVMVTEDGRVLILDFGLAAELEKGSGAASIVGFAGTPGYAAPEQLSGQHTGASDWYSVGTMLYEALTDARPFQGNGIEMLREKNDRDAPPIDDLDGIPETLDHWR